MPSNQNEGNSKEKIFEVIEKASPQDLSIQEIAEISKLSRETVSKYVGILEAEKKIALARRIGKAKMYRLIEEG
ncbi:HTH domain-containing protein [candidate division WOR-3 bacterium]|nr:HTH domain-containing protein [candidate division WOR-3 bacterium]